MRSPGEGSFSLHVYLLCLELDFIFSLNILCLLINSAFTVFWGWGCHLTKGPQEAGKFSFYKSKPYPGTHTHSTSMTIGSDSLL